MIPPNSLAFLQVSLLSWQASPVQVMVARSWINSSRRGQYFVKFQSLEQIRMSSFQLGLEVKLKIHSLNGLCQSSATFLYGILNLKEGQLCWSAS